MKKTIVKLFIVFAMIALASGCVRVPATSKSAGLKVPAQEIRKYPNGTNVTVTVSRLNLRECPKIKCKILTVLNRGTKVIVYGSSGKWIKVNRGNDKMTGWIYSDYVQRSSIIAENTENETKLDSHAETSSGRINSQKLTREILSDDQVEGIDTVEDKEIIVNKNSDNAAGRTNDILLEDEVPLLEDDVVLSEEGENDPAQIVIPYGQIHDGEILPDDQMAGIDTVKEKEIIVNKNSDSTAGRTNDILLEDEVPLLEDDVILSEEDGNDPAKIVIPGGQVQDGEITDEFM